MYVENIVTSLEISKKLAELKIHERTFFYWDYHNNNKSYSLSYFSNTACNCNGDRFPAFTAEELIKILPTQIEVENYPAPIFFRLNIKILLSSPIEYEIDYFSEAQIFSLTIKKFDKNLVDCLGKLLIELKEKGYL